MHGYLSLDIICSSKLTVFLELRSRKTVRFSEQIMSADKYPCIFSRQMETIVYIFVNIHVTVLCCSIGLVLQRNSPELIDYSIIRWESSDHSNYLLFYLIRQGRLAWQYAAFYTFNYICNWRLYLPVYSLPVIPSTFVMYVFLLHCITTVIPSPFTFVQASAKFT